MGLLACLMVPAAAAGATEHEPWVPEKNPWEKSIGFYVGHELTEDGSVLLGGFGHEPSSHWIEIVPRQEHPEGATVQVGVTEESRIPGELIDIPQVPETNKYITSNYSEYAGFPPPLTNGGLNEHHVAARDIWSPSRSELVQMTETPQTGPNYSDLARFAMERASTAREAVEVVGGLIDEHGYSTYGGNSHLFADQEEGWVFINYAGSAGLWAAQRLGPDDVRVSYPGYLDPFPLDYQDDPDFMASDNFIDFAVEQGWWDPEGQDEFDPQEVYAGWQPAYQLELEDELRDDLAPVSVEDMLAYVRDPRWSNDRSGYGHVAHLRDDVHPELGVLWVAITGAVTTPFVPIHLGAEDVPPEFKQHRYMTKGADSQFLDRDYAPLEATRYATRTFKRLMYHTCENPDVFLKPVTAHLEAFERTLLDEQEKVERKALRRYEQGREDEARDQLTEYVDRRLIDSLNLGERLVRDVEEETRERFGIRMPTGEDIEGETARPESQDMNRGNDFVQCLDWSIDDYPRLHGSYADLVDDRKGPPFDPPGPPDERPGPPEGKGKQSSSGGPGLAGTVGLLLAGATVGGAAARIRLR
jgi:dipeptidase